jgi:hypothetical protein
VISGMGVWAAVSGIMRTRFDCGIRADKMHWELTGNLSMALLDNKALLQYEELF